MLDREEAKKLDDAKSVAADAWRRRDWDQAITGYKQCIADLERLFGPKHGTTLAWKASLQELYSDQALAIQKQLAADRESSLGPDHPDTLIARVRLQEMLHVKRLPLNFEAENQLAAECARVLGPDHPDTFSISALTQGFGWSRGPGEGLSMEAEEQLVADCERILGPDHPTTSTLQRGLAARRAESAPLLFDDPSWR
jgi:hypothetical protein